MSNKVEFVFDFASPNAYLAYRAIGRVLDRTGAELKVIPCLLGGIFKATGNHPPMVAFKDVQGKLDYDRIEIVRFIKQHGLTNFKFNPNFPVNTLLLMRGAVAAEMNGDLDNYIAIGLKAMWEDGLKMDDPEVYQKVFSDGGLDGAGLIARSQDPVVKAKLLENTSAVVERGTFGVPTFFVGGEMFFGKDRLAQVEAELMRAA